MVTRAELTAYLDDLLAIGAIPGDKSANGLQVEGGEQVTCVIGAVDACVQAYEQTIAAGGNFLFVHHGEFWGDGIRRLTGRLAHRFRLLLRHDLSLYAAHLPLDAHPVLGHNAVIAAQLGLREPRPFAEYAGAEVGIHGLLPEPLTVAQLGERLDGLLTTTCRGFDFAERPLRRVGIVSGGGDSALAECPHWAVDCLITGEVGHTAYHVMRELRLGAIAAGHYRTEVPGVVAVLDAIHQRFGLPVTMLDLPTGL